MIVARILAAAGHVMCQPAAAPGACTAFSDVSPWRWLKQRSGGGGGGGVVVVVVVVIVVVVVGGGC